MMKVERYNHEVITYLQEKNIFVENGGDYNINYLGIVLNTIKNDATLEKSVLIAKNPATIAARDFNIILLEFYNSLILAVGNNSHTTNKTESQNFM